MASAMRKMKLNRNFTLDTTYGHSIRFEKGVATNVPPICQAAALAIGAEFEDGEGVVEEAAPVSLAPVDPGERAKSVLAAVNAIAERNDKDEFSAGGMPKVEAVSKQAGYKVSGKEIITAWQAFHDAAAAAKLS